jgi:hypothetical protein
MFAVSGNFIICQAPAAKWLQAVGRVSKNDTFGASKSHVKPKLNLLQPFSGF